MWWCMIYKRNLILHHFGEDGILELQLQLQDEMMMQLLNMDSKSNIYSCSTYNLQLVQLLYSSTVLSTNMVQE